MNDVVTRKGSSTITEFINSLVIAELREEYPSIKLKDNIDIPGAIQAINKNTGDRFVFINTFPNNRTIELALWA